MDSMPGQTTQVSVFNSKKLFLIHLSCGFKCTWLSAVLTHCVWIIEEKPEVSEVARGLYIPCPEHYKNYCVHGDCEYPNMLSTPSCRYTHTYTQTHDVSDHTSVSCLQKYTPFVIVCVTLYHRSLSPPSVQAKKDLPHVKNCFIMALAILVLYLVKFSSTKWKRDMFSWQ